MNDRVFVGIAIDGPLKGQQLRCIDRIIRAAAPYKLGGTSIINAVPKSAVSSYDVVTYRWFLKSMPHSLLLDVGDVVDVLTWDEYEPVWKCGRDFRDA